MSHVSAYQTEIRNLDLATRAAQALDIPVFPDATHIQSYYMQELPDGTRSQQVPVDLVLGSTFFGVGLQLQENGTYAVICDVFDADKKMLAKFGPDFHEWKLGVPYEGATPGHIPVGSPATFLQQYAIEAGLDAAAKDGMDVDKKRFEDDNRVVLKMTGGRSLLPGQWVEFTAYDDGSSAIAVFGVEGETCLGLPKFLDDTLGTVTHQVLTKDYYHDRAGQHVNVKVRQ